MADPTIPSVVSKMSSLVDAWRTYITQVRDWLAGTSTGGPGSDGSYPYSVSWTATTTGSFTITAVATDSRGAKTTSAPVKIDVVPAGGGTVAVLQRRIRTGSRLALALMLLALLAMTMGHAA